MKKHLIAGPIVLIAIASFLGKSANASEMVVTGNASSGGILDEGDYIGEIVEVSFDKPKNNKNYKSDHEQMKVVFKTEDGRLVSEWFNLEAFVRYNEKELAPIVDMICNSRDYDKVRKDFKKNKGVSIDATFKALTMDQKMSALFEKAVIDDKATKAEYYAINKLTGLRIISEERQQQSLDIIGRLATAAGALPEGEALNIAELKEELIGHSVAFTVAKNDRGNTRVTKIRPVDAEAGE